MKKMLFILSLVLFIVQMKAQNPMQKHIESLSSKVFSKENLFKNKDVTADNAKALGQYVHNFALLEVDKAILEDMTNSPAEALEITLPFNGSTVTLQLVKNKVVDGQTIFSTQKEAPINYQQGAYYSGVIKGQPHSIVAMSFFNNDIMGVIATETSNYVLGKSNTSDAESNEYIVYDEKNLLVKDKSDCGTDDKVGKTPFIPNQAAAVAAGTNCVKVYIECDYQMYLNHGSNTTTVLNYVTGLFNVVSTLYQNESIPMAVSQVKVWTATDPYAATTNTSTALAAFQTAMSGGFNGDLAHLFSARNLGGGKASGFGVLCGTNSFKTAVSGNLTTATPTFPTYSWNAMVVTHEMGHCLGSRHTHACVWNGNNTAIDGCSGFTEGGCTLPGFPSAGGTIMSYCHAQSVGINFSLGFGLQPGNVIRNHVNSSTCLSSCSACPTNITITGNYTTALTESQTWIKTTGTTTIASTASVKLDATPTVGFVELNPGFSTNSGAFFVAQAFNGCTQGAPNLREPVVAFGSSKTPNNTVKALNKLVLEQNSPNPTSGVTTINYTVPQDVSSTAHIIFRDITGKQIAQYSLTESTSGSITVDVSQWTNGFYIYAIVAEGRVLAAKKMVVSKQ